MLNIDMRKIYNFYAVEPAPDPAALPTGGDLYYECLDCAAGLDAAKLDAPFKQASGALAMLGHFPAVSCLKEARTAIDAFTAPGYQPTEELSAAH